MSILGTMMSKILGKAPAAVAAPANAPKSAPQAAAPANVPGAPPSAMASVDVAAVLDALKDKASQDLNWKTSIVDLMKVLSMDSSLAARKELAKELHYNGDTSDSASMNIWLHQQIMKKLAENGGKLPGDIKHS
jgi:3-oxoacyl-ACP reductase-like protein